MGRHFGFVRSHMKMSLKLPFSINHDTFSCVIHASQTLSIHSAVFLISIVFPLTNYDDVPLLLSLHSMTP